MEAKAQEQQDKMHGQTFDGEGIEDILALIPADVERIRREVDVARLELFNTRRPDTVAIVDITDLLVALFEPDQKTRGWIRDIRQEPFPETPRRDQVSFSRSPSPTTHDRYRRREFPQCRERPCRRIDA